MLKQNVGWLVCVAVMSCWLPMLGADLSQSYAKKGTWQATFLSWHEAIHRSADQSRSMVPLPDFGADHYTVMAWIKTRQGGTLVARTHPTGPWVPQGKSFFIRDGRLTLDVGWVGAVQGKTVVTDGQWHHVAVACQEKTLTFYVDGQADGGGRLDVKPDETGFVLKVGNTSSNFPAQSGFEGLMDELCVFGKTLSAEEIRQWRLSPESSDATHLVGYWPFDENLKDASGHRHDPVQATAMESVTGRLGKALVFKGQDQIMFAASGHGGVLAEMWARLSEDFQDDRSVQEMAWEQEDGLWLKAFAPGNWQALARRYAEHCVRVPEIAARATASMTRVSDEGSLAEIRALYYRSRRQAKAGSVLAQYNPAGLRRTIEAMIDQGIPQGTVSLRRLELIEDLIRAWVEGQTTVTLNWEGLKKALGALSHQILVSETEAMDFQKILFVKRHTYQSSHYYTDYIDGCEKYGGNICVLDLETGEVRDIVPAMKHGIFGRYDLSFDGQRLVFDWKEKEGVGFRIYEVQVDGTGLRQLTFPPEDEAARIEKYWQRNLGSWAGRPVTYRHHTDDMSPCYLPDGGICFISTRCELGILCDGPDYFTTTVLYRMDGDGAHIKKLSNSSLSEAYPSVMNDGRILYTRWEYVDKGAVSTKCLWAMLPDGSGSVEIYGNDIAIPSGFFQGRAIPGSAQDFVVLGGPHCCPMNGVGTVIRLDMNRDYRTREPMTYVTPYIRMTESGHGGFRHLREGQWVVDLKGPLFIDPFPLSKTLFLVSQNLDREWREFDAWDLYLLDDCGRSLLIYDDPEISCYQPMPLRARTSPPVLAGQRDPDLKSAGLARIVVTDVYSGLTGVKRGEVKYIRVNEQVPRPWGARRAWGGDVYDQQHACITKDTHLGLKVQHGIVPVHEDGSAHFLVPADKNIFFQVLDKDYKEIQRERTFVNYMPGETRSCVGCHERNIDAAPVTTRKPMALSLPADRLGPQPGEASGRRVLHYPTDVQPILDRHCITCHGSVDPKGDLDLTGALTLHFSRSYENILARELIPVIGENHPKWGNVHYLPPTSLGSYASTLIAHLEKGVCDVELSLAEWVRLRTWVDSNGQYYGSYYGRRNLKFKDHPNFRPVPTFQEAVSPLPPLAEDER